MKQLKGFTAFKYNPEEWAALINETKQVKLYRGPGRLN